MKLTHLANQRVIISRMVAVTGNNKILSTVTAALVNLQPAQNEKQQMHPGVTGKLYKIFTDGDIDFQEGDQIKDEDGNIYTVRHGGVTRWRHGAMDYKEVLLTRSTS